MKKFYFAMLAVATMAFVGCEPKPGPIIIDDDPDEDLVLPIVANPAAGMTTVVLHAPENTTEYGMYAVGKIDGTNDWKEKDIDTYRFTKIAGEDRWYQFTFPYAADMEIKVCAIPSDPTLAGWSYQWAKNADPNDPNCTETEDHVIIAQGTGNFVYENGGQPKLLGLADGGVIFIDIKAWAADPNIKDEPAATAAIKHPWNGGDWTYQEMTKENDTTFTYKSRFGNNGCNIALDVNGTQETWYPNDGTIIFEAEQDFAVGDSVEFKFISRKGTAGVVYVTMLEKGEAPEAIPAGHGKFTVTVSNRTYTESDVCIFTGNFEEKSWGDSDRAMTYDNATSTWTWEGDYPENFEYKVIYNGSWANGDNVKFDGETFTASFEIQ